MAILLQPPEIQLRIFKQISLVEILHFRLVSRQWKEMLERIGSFRSDLRIVSQYRGSSTPFISIKLNDTRWDDQQLKLSSDGARFLSTVFPNIKNAIIIFDIKEFTTAECFHLAVLRDWSPGLVSLHLDMQCFQKGPSLVSMKHEELWQIISSMDQLKQLKLSYLGRIQLPPEFTAFPDQLEELVIGLCDTMEFIEQALDRVSPALKRLTVPKLPRPSQSVLAKIASSVTYLKIIDKHVQMTELLDSLRYMTNLTHVDFNLLDIFGNQTSFSILMDTIAQLPHLYSVALSNYPISEHLRQVNPDRGQGRAPPPPPPYRGSSSQTVKELYIFYNPGRFLPCSVLAKAFPAVIRVFILGTSVHSEQLAQGAPDGEPVSCATLVKRHFGQQTEMLFVNTRRVSY